MSKKEGYSRKGLFGEIKHYDANGRKISAYNLSAHYTFPDL